MMDTVMPPYESNPMSPCPWWLKALFYQYLNRNISYCATV